MTGTALTQTGAPAPRQGTVVSLLGDLTNTIDLSGHGALIVAYYATTSQESET